MRYSILFCFVLCYLANTRGDSAECGKTASSNQEIGTHPWHVGIFKTKSTNNSYTIICGGTIIHPKFIVTAGHCLENKSADKINKEDYRVVAGKINRLWDKQEASQQTVKVTDIVIHDKFAGNKNRYAGDIALIKVDPPFSFKSSVSPVCINQNNIKVENNKLGTMVGWILPWGKNQSDILQESVEPIISGEECIKKSEEYVAQLKTFITEDKFCTFNKDGDGPEIMSGGGVFYEDNGKIHLHGIISIGSRTQNHIVGHSSIPYYHDWINKNMNERL